MDTYLRDSLKAVVESRVLPKLFATHSDRLWPGESGFDREFVPDSEEVAMLARMCVHGLANSAAHRIAHWVNHGVAMEDILLKLVAPVALYLDGMWDQDSVDFPQISLGLMRLQQITHQLGHHYHARPRFSAGARRILIASPPGSQHLLGLSIVAEIFRKDGWQVVAEIADTQTTLLNRVGSEWFDLVGLSVCLTEQLASVPALVAQLKHSSKNREVSVILGGSAFLGSDAQGREFGADAISADAQDAVMLGNLLVDNAFGGYVS